MDPSALDDEFRDFVEKWTHPDYRPMPETESSLARLERQFALKLPIAYRHYMLRFGSGGTTKSLLHSIAERALEVNDVSEIHSVEKVIELTKAWRDQGLPIDYVAIASDCAGNEFCLQVSDCQTEGQQDAAIWFFDHDFQTVEKEADSFVHWLRALTMVDLVNE
jgi:hypothetical protein